MKTLLKPRERDINAGIKTLLELDGWHVFLMETVSRREWGKYTGEVGMPDILAIRYCVGPMGLFSRVLSQVLWCEGKRPHGIVAPNQRLWHAAERERGALVIVAGEDFEASCDGWLAWYRKSGLMRREIL